MSIRLLNRLAFLGFAIVPYLAMSGCGSPRALAETSNAATAAGLASASPAADPDALRSDLRSTEAALAAVSVPGTGATPSFKRKQLLNKLRELRISVNFEDTKLSDAIVFFSDYSAIPITVASDVDTMKEIPKFRLVEVRLQEAFTLLLANAGLTYTFRGHGLHVGKPSTLKLNLLFGVYRVSDILATVRCSHCPHHSPPIRVVSDADDDAGGASPFSFDEEDEQKDCLDASDLIDLVIESTGGEQLWENTGSTIEREQSQLLIHATLELHFAVRTLLSDLRGAP